MHQSSGHVDMLGLDITHVAEASGRWQDPQTWPHGQLPGPGSCVLIPPGIRVELAGEAEIECVDVEGELVFDRAADSTLRVDTILVERGGRFEIGTPEAPATGKVLVEFSDAEATDWERLGHGLLAMGDLSIWGQETTSFVHVLGNPRAGDTKLHLASVPKNWQVGGVVVVPGVRPTLPIGDGKRPPIGPDSDRDPVFRKQHELRTIAAISCDEITLNAPLEHDLHHQVLGNLKIPIGYLTRNIHITSKNHAVARRGHVMVMPAPDDVHEYTIGYAEFAGLGRTDVEQFHTDPQKDTAGNVIPATVANPRGRYALHFHKNGFASHATVKGVSVRDGLKWGVVNHSSNVDVLDSITFNVRGAGFATEIGNEMGSFQRCLSVCHLGFGDLNESATRTGRQARKGRPEGTPEEKLIAPLGGDFGFNGSGFWLQSARVRLVGNLAYGCASVGFNVQTLPFGTDHLGRPTAIYVPDLTPAERAWLITDPKQTKITCNNFPLRMEGNVAVGCERPMFDWENPVGPAVGGSVVGGMVARNCGAANEVGECGFFVWEDADFANDPAAMNKRQVGTALDLYNRVDLDALNFRCQSGNVAIDTVHLGTTRIRGAKTLLSCPTNIKIRPGKFEVSIEIGEENFGNPNGRNIVADGDIGNRPVFWRRPGKQPLRLVKLGTPGGVALPGLVNLLAVEE